MSIEQQKFIQKDLLACINKFNIRCLNKSLKWASDLLLSLSDNLEDEMVPIDPSKNLSIKEHAKITMAGCLFNLGEYKRAAFYAKNLNTPAGMFLHFYSEYKELQKQEWEQNGRDLENCMMNKPVLQYTYKTLLESICNFPNPDSFIIYLKGILFSKFKNSVEAQSCFITSINQDPLNWPAWIELAYSITTFEDYESILPKLPDNWIKDIFIIETELNLGINKYKKAKLEYVFNYGLAESIFIKIKVSSILKSMDFIEKSKISMEEITKQDPYCIDHLDTYSNILYLQQDIVGLSKIVHATVLHSRYKPETCFAIGNLYNAANLHAEAALYFKQALLLDPQFTHAWTLLGHEFIEVKNIPSAMASYRKSLELNPSEYRAWYGLGQVYELMKMPGQSLSLYKKAYYLKPNDPKLSYAVARAFEAIDNKSDCIDMLKISIENGDPEGAATIKLACLLESINKEEAVVFYKRFLHAYDDNGMAKSEDSSMAAIYLMNYYIDKEEFEHAEIYARRGCRYNQSLKHSEYVLQKIDKIMSDRKLKGNKQPLLPTRPQLFSKKPKDDNDDFDMDMALSP